ncbi:MAG TPA: amidohydrolase [Gaiellaceae bacterium]|nr:amidohydrolase [Gaiellaceae bacterium]
MDPNSVDLLLRGGRVHTVSSGTAEAVAVRGGRIAAVGSDAELAGLSAQRVVELEGRTVLPGFQDAHLHPFSGGMLAIVCNLHETTSAEECLVVIGRYAAEHPEREWVAGDGWSMDFFPGGNPDRERIDAVVLDRPVYLENRDGHTAWVNGRALELAGIGRDTTNPPDGRIERDAAGEPSGALHEGAMRLVGDLVPPPSAAELEQALLNAQAELHALGITAWQDAVVEAETLAAYRAVAERGQLTMRAEGNLLWNRTRGEEQIDELLALREQGTLGRLRIRGAKIFQDGVLENFTGALLEPYEGSDNRGMSMHEPEELERMLTLLDGHGFQVHLHTIGDRAVREALDAVEAAQRANGRRDARHHLAHIQLVHPADQPRFAELRVVANAQPYWATHSRYVDELTLPFIGEERARYHYPFGSLVRAGAPLAFGSDWTVSTADPLPQIEVAVTRVLHPERDTEPMLPGERLDLATAVAASTRGSAYVNFLEDETGTIDPGKLADLVVLDRDLFDPGAGPVGDARVLLTLSEGDPVHDLLA